MPIPEFVVALRSKIGHDPLPLSGVIAVVADERGRILLVRRSDTGAWALPTGCLEPGEQPADGAVREVFEETGVDVAVERLLSVEALELAVAPNGDQVHWLAIGFRCRLRSGVARGERRRVRRGRLVRAAHGASPAISSGPLPGARVHRRGCLVRRALGGGRVSGVRVRAGPW